MRIIERQIVENGEKATFTGYLLSNTEEVDPTRTRPAVLILPGGGYLMTSDRENEPVAMKMLSFGYQAFVLNYSVAPATYPTALLQAGAAMRLIREHAAEWQVNAESIMLMGFSAGGHLALNLAEAWNGEVLRSHGFAPEQIKPNGLALGYPVVSAGRYAHAGSFENLLGRESGNPELRDEVSLEKHASAAVPPVFLFHTMTDPSVPVMNSLLLVKALHEVGVEVEAHFFPSGRHGVSLATRETMYADGSGIEPCVQAWPRLFHRWATERFEAGDPLQ